MLIQLAADIRGYVYDVFVVRFDGWLVFGILAQAVFGARFVVQWLASERAGRSVIPLAFWFLSIAGGLMTLVYGLVRREPVIIFGQALSTFIYLRNVVLILRERRARMTAFAPAPLPPFYDDLDASLLEVWRLLAEGPALRRNAFHMPALATVDADGHPQVRTVVLREADPATGTLRFHCDRRSAKAVEIAASGRAALHGYDTASKIQIRVSGPARLHTDDALAEAAWSGSRVMSRTCYGIAPAPGTALPAGDAYTQPEDGADLDLSRANFCAVVVTATRLDFLFLDRRGHRRAGWVRGAAGWTGTWLAP